VRWHYVPKERIVLAEVLRFKRQPKPRRQRWRPPKAAWLVMALLVGAVSAGYLTPDLGWNSISGTGGFTLCVRASQTNCVVDGDTVRHGGVTIRLADIDAPETHEPKCASEAALGKQATQRLLQLINAGPFDVVRVGSRDEDRYRRKLRVIERDGRSVGAVLVAEGLARRWDGARRSWCG
jgi:endonuclease YncB( thermonuclease family)